MAALLPIGQIVEKLNIAETLVEPWGRHIAKLRLELLSTPRPPRKRRLILVTAMTSTSSGEEKPSPRSDWRRHSSGSASRQS